MKKMIYKSALIFCTLFLSIAAVSGGKPFEGVITFKITYPDNKFSESQMAMFPKLMTVSVKGTKSRMDMQVAGANTVEIRDHADKSVVALLNIMGQKYSIKQTTSDIEKELAAECKPTVELSAETKVIAGYTCQKAIVTMNNDGIKTTFEGYY